MRSARPFDRTSIDMIAIPGNPLDDIELLRKVNFVMKDGKVIRKP